ncbi:MAG: zinc-binding alcohol dehydrogenase family protein [Betaproteobacteria bacterium]|nr:zinc-binding alcohol dehydrogenase family protein [Betaproteobacteria bacterium]
MHAAVLTAGAAPVYESFDSPVAREGAALVTVTAAALARVDIAVASGRHYTKPSPGRFVLGREGVGRLASGRRVYFNFTSCLWPFGSMAEQTLVDPSCLLDVPEGIPDALAAALGNAGLAAWLPLSWRARLRPGETVLVIGATGLSGLIAVAAARLLGAGCVVAAGRNRDVLERCRALGADAIVNLNESSDLVAAYANAARGPIDVVLDYLCGPPAEAALEALAKGGRMVHIGTTVATEMKIAGQTLRRTSADILGFAYYHAPIEVQQEAYSALCRHAAAGRIVIDYETLPLCEVREAWDRQLAGSRRRLVLLP